jgi:cation transport protein ChaC
MTLPDNATVSDAFAAPEPRPDFPRIALAPGAPFWVFAYGSLMWHPGFAYEERQTATLFGYHRRFCVLSHRYRGTSERPGLVLGLDRGGSCRGLAFAVAPALAEATVAYLWEREMVTGVYRPRLLPVRLADGRQAAACCFVADRRHAQYCGLRDAAGIAAVIADRHGMNGPNVEYLYNTIAHLRELGIRDAGLEEIAERMGSGIGTGAGSAGVPPAS